ncbi:MAG: xanthine phosphoribosyltransferase [Clostridiales bacterium]|nr:xanthine phosphoribosyltransferase [Clostridiales bacterium]
MELLQKKILKYGRVFDGNILKVDSFLNHQVDINLLTKVGEQFAKQFKAHGVTKILTIEASGIIVAAFTAQKLNVPMLFAKKTQSKNLSSSVYTTHVMSYTHGKVYDIFVEKEYLNANDTVLIVDDFLANGQALLGLIDIVKQSGAKLVGCGVAIEKGFQGGGDKLRSQGIRVESLACIDSMTDNTLVFRQ